MKRFEPHPQFTDTIPLVVNFKLYAKFTWHSHLNHEILFLLEKLLLKPSHRYMRDTTGDICYKVIAVIITLNEIEISDL